MNAPAPRVAIAGEALIDLLIEDDRRRPTASPGGSPANTAITLARLGTSTTFLGRFGDDSFGSLLRDNLAANGVRLDHAVDTTEPASVAVVTSDEAGGATYRFHVTGTADWAWSPAELPAMLPVSVAALHTGSLALALPPGAEVLADWYRRAPDSVVRSFDPNIRPALVGPRAEYVPRLESLVAASDIVKVSAEDIDWAYPGTDPLDVAHAWQGDGGPAVVVVTLGGDGAVACRDGRTVRAPAAGLPIADTVGAGDAFSGGLLHWLSESDFLRRERLRLLTDEELRMSLEYAATVAGVTCTRPGADPPRAREVATLLPHSFRAR